MAKGWWFQGPWDLKTPAEGGTTNHLLNHTANGSSGSTNSRRAKLLVRCGTFLARLSLSSWSALGVSPITHFLTSWLVANIGDLEVKEQAAITLAGVTPDLDGVGIVA